ncbi:hypothetical protein [Leptospira koniambonensis]|nr:hypothetical protein [Leptospira koniambonensis]
MEQFAGEGNLFADIYYEGDSVKIKQFRDIGIPASYQEYWKTSNPIK